MSDVWWTEACSKKGIKKNLFIMGSDDGFVYTHAYCRVSKRLDPSDHSPVFPPPTLLPLKQNKGKKGKKTG